ncbi:uncharacterized protein LOC130721080 isoform X2 [Lotus japonicus]|uniref:uncharacterized protein LOC130721080 isoform X2 n=1 Tax=Lotus japonicus TaxID=34305 RepID=UPI00258E670E|nr:uncharacterized protein LOC130721080 isoform X2 [Lotus japonicus]
MSNEDPGISGRQYKDTVIFGFTDRIPSDDETDNICLQTGEEFSAEFLRDRVALTRFPVITDADQQRLPNRLDFNVNNNNYQMVYEDLKHVLGLSRENSDSNPDLLETGLARGYGAEIDNRAYPNNLSRYHWEHGGVGQTSGTFSRQLSSKFSDGSSCDQVTPGPNAPIYAMESPHSCHPHGSLFSEGSFYKKIKFLCSSGGRILPRPNDGKLRYVGGETRIISIRKNITWEELMTKTSAICDQTHIIKYQLPGEDLDALISVCSDEDLHHMIEEYEELERAGGSQRLRIFLILANESESPISNDARVNPPSDADYHYFVAVNGMLDPSPRKNLSGLNLASHTTQFGNNSDYNSPHFHRDSSTSSFASEAKDNPTSPNLVGKLSKRRPHLLTALKVAANSFNQTPPLSPISVQPKDSKISNVQPKDPKIYNVQLFRDQPYNVVNESISPFVTEKDPRENSLFVENTSYVDPIVYYNSPSQGSPRVNYHPSNQYVLESDQVRKPSDDFHFHRRNNSKDFVSPAICSQTDMIFERPLGTNEGSYHFNKIVSHPHDRSSLFSVSDGREGSQYRILHALSDPILEENDENYKVRMPFPPNAERDKMSSWETSSSLEECSIQPGEIANRKEHVAQYQNFPTFGMADSFHRVSEIGKENMQRADKSTNWFDEKLGPMSQDKNLQYIYYPHGVCSSSPDLQSDECNVSAGPYNSSESTSNMTEQSHGLPLDVISSQFSMRSQNSSTHHRYSMSEPKDSQPLHPGSSELQPVESQTEIESMPPVSYTDLVHSSSRDVILDEDHACHLYQKEESTVINKQSSKYIDELCVNKPEPVAAVKGPIDYITSGIQSRLRVSNLDEEDEVELTSPEREELAKADSGNFYTPTGDTETVETEVDINGLQIIENGDLEEQQELGSGTFGTVYHGKWRGTDVAIKRIKSSCFAGRLSEQERLTKDFWREARILSTLHHPNVVAFYGVVPDGPGGTLATVTEYMVHGSLRNVLLKKDRVLDRRKRLMIAMDAAFGMEYLHLKNIVHFDLKCDNLLVNLGDPERPVCKVGDFGLSRIKRNTLVSGGVRGTLPWMAPELLDGNSSRVSEKVDIFSFGIAMWEILTGEEPYANMHCGAIIGGIVNNTLRPPIPKRCDSEWKKLMEECWSPDPAARPTFTEVRDRLRNMSAALQKKRPHIGNR